MAPDPTRDDISFLKRISEEGRYAPLLGGRYLVMWGSIVTVAYLFQFLILSRRLPLPEWSLAVMWLVAMLIALAFMSRFPKHLRSKPGRNAINNQVEKWVWTAGGMAISAFAAGTFVAVVISGAPTLLFDMIVAIALAAYGTALYVVSRIASQAWMVWPAVISFISTGIIPFVAGQPATYLVGAVSIVLVAVIPGLVLMRAEPAALQEA